MDSSTGLPQTLLAGTVKLFFEDTVSNQELGVVLLLSECQLSVF